MRPESRVSQPDSNNENAMTGQVLQRQIHSAQTTAHSTALYNSNKPLIFAPYLMILTAALLYACETLTVLLIFLLQKKKCSVAYKTTQGRRRMVYFRLESNVQTISKLCLKFRQVKVLV